MILDFSYVNLSWPCDCVEMTCLQTDHINSSPSCTLREEECESVFINNDMPVMKALDATEANTYLSFAQRQQDCDGIKVDCSMPFLYSTDGMTNCDAYAP